MPSQAIVGIVLVLGGLAASVALAMTGRTVPSIVASIVVAGLGILAHVSWSRAHGEVKRLRAEMKRTNGADTISPPADVPETPVVASTETPAETPKN
jgi:hypothetical protein